MFTELAHEKKTKAKASTFVGIQRKEIEHSWASLKIMFSFENLSFSSYGLPFYLA